MSQRLRTGVAVLQLAVVRGQCKIVSKRINQRRVLVLDIDNTIADSWPSLVAPTTSERERLASLPLLGGMKAATFDRASAQGDAVVFLSHRSLRWWIVTWRWFRDRDLGVSPLHLWCVPNASDKIELVENLSANHDVEIWDDLHRLHETGTAVAYGSIIEAFESMPIEYHGADDIDAIVAQAAESATPTHRMHE